MNSREKILNAVRGNQPGLVPLPEGGGLLPGSAAGQSGVSGGEPQAENASPDQRFMQLVETIGGKAYVVRDFDKIVQVLKEQYPDARRIVSGCPELEGAALGGRVEINLSYEDPHSLEDTDIAVLRAHFGVAENGACWITEDRMVSRVLPFICQQLVLVVGRRDIVANMQEAYAWIAKWEAGAAGGKDGGVGAGAAYGFATFIAGPSKTADIEQSLVLGAHGPVSLTVFLLDEEGPAAGLTDAGYF